MTLRALATGVLAAVLAIVAWHATGGEPGRLEWEILERTSRGVPGSGVLVVVTRDAESEARYGTAAWDAAVIARFLGAVARGGAAAIGVDGGATTGGPASAALLEQATALAGVAVYPVAGALPAGPARRAKAVGHTTAEPEADGVVRRVPLYTRVDGVPLPAFGLALAATAATTSFDDYARRLRTDPSGRVLVPFGSGALPGRPMSFADLPAAVERGELEDKIVLLLAAPAGDPVRTPPGPMSAVAVQAHLLNGVLTGARLHVAPPAWAAVCALALGIATGLAWLALSWWAALLVTAVLALAVLAVAAWLLVATGALITAWPALAAAGIATVVALVWNRLTADVRIRDLEAANVRARDELVRRESAVEALEEDLEAARAAVARSTDAERDLGRAADALAAELAKARAQEESTRARLAQLEAALRGRRPPGAGDADAERLGIVTRDPAVLGLFRDLEKAARSTLPILLAGEPGTGKELFARAAHRLSPRAAGPFVAVNMAAIPPELFESELFGHVRGAFTGATADRKGWFEQADGGTIFLDEIGDVRADHQGKLLRVLQDKTFYRVGALKATTVDVRVVAATNRDLERGVAQGWFREDLYFRLKGLVLRLPPLRERPGDLPLLAERLLAEALAEHKRDDLTLSDEARQAIARHDWPGNIRELANVLRQAAALAEGPLITAADLRLPGAREAGGEPTGDGAVLACLRRHGFDMQATARELGWDRSTVTQRLKGLGFRALVDAAGDRARAAAALAGDPALAHAVELKLTEYHEHLLRSVDGYPDADTAVAACRRRFKNLPERHFRSLETLVRQRFDR